MLLGRQDRNDLNQKYFRGPAPTEGAQGPTVSTRPEAIASVANDWK